MNKEKIVNDKYNQKTNIFIFIGVLLAILTLLGFNFFKRPFESRFALPNKPLQQVKTSEQKKPKKETISPQVVVDKLSVEQKIAQMIAQPLIIDKNNFVKNNTTKNDSIKDDSEFKKDELISRLSPGFITIFGNKISSSSAKQKINEVKNFYKNKQILPKFIVDHEGGTVQRLNGNGYTKLPSWKNVCALDKNDRKNILEQSARELKETGIDIVLAPMLDVGDNKVLKDRICSNSYAEVADRSVEFISIFDSFNILPVAKHFPGIGKINKDLHNNFDFGYVLTGDAELYKYVFDNSSKVAVMISHVGVASQDPQIPCSLSKSCIDEFKKIYAKPLIFSDALEMEAASFNKDDVSHPKDIIEVSKEAVIAGDEVLIYGQSITSSDIKKIISSLSSEYKYSKEFKAIVDNAVLKIVSYKLADNNTKYEN